MRLLGGFVQLSTRLHLARINDSLSVEMEEKRPDILENFSLKSSGRIDIGRFMKFERQIWNRRTSSLAAQKFFVNFLYSFGPDSSGSWNKLPPGTGLSTGEVGRNTCVFCFRLARKGAAIQLNETGRLVIKILEHTHWNHRRRKYSFTQATRGHGTNQRPAGRHVTWRWKYLADKKLRGFLEHVFQSDKRRREDPIIKQNSHVPALEHEIFLSFLGPKVGVSLVCLFLCCSVNRMSLLFTFFSASPQRTFRAPDGSLSSSFRQIVLN